MKKNNFLFLLIGVMLTAAMITAIISLVKRYERDSVSAPQPVPRQVPEEESLKNIVPLQQNDNQPPTENGKFLQ
jgi:hypothetical protein